MLGCPGCVPVPLVAGPAKEHGRIQPVARYSDGWAFRRCLRPWCRGLTAPRSWAGVDWCAKVSNSGLKADMWTVLPTVGRRDLANTRTRCGLSESAGGKARSEVCRAERSQPPHTHARQAGLVAEKETELQTPSTLWVPTHRENEERTWWQAERAVQARLRPRRTADRAPGRPERRVEGAQTSYRRPGNLVGEALEPESWVVH